MDKDETDEQLDSFLPFVLGSKVYAGKKFCFKILECECVLERGVSVAVKRPACTPRIFMRERESERERERERDKASSLLLVITEHISTNTFTHPQACLRLEPMLMHAYCY